LVKRKTIFESCSLKKYSYSKQEINKSDIISVIKTLKFNNLSRGPAVDQFENKLKKITNSKFAVAVNSGTSALIGAINSLSLKKNSTILVPNITFVATASSVLLSGFKVELIDVSEDTGLVIPDELSKKLQNKNISCFINVHLNGNIENLPLIHKICKKKKVKIIDDACHALGTTFKNKKKLHRIGDNAFCDISTFSFHPTKLITTGEGGAILTNNIKYFSKIKKITNHGYENYKIKNKNYYHNYYKIVEPGYNFRISDLNCSLGLSQLNRFRSKIKHRRKIALLYNNYFKDNENINILKINPSIKSAHHLYPIFIKDYKKINKIELMDKLKKKNIFTQIHYLPISKQPLFNNNNKKFLKSDKYFQKVLSIPIHDGIKLKDIKFISKTIDNELRKINER
jgi:UDP-4-amino-4,6-dideoxy-L-N-acetyl-beta-L-altrosamine transaminase